MGIFRVFISIDIFISSLHLLNKRRAFCSRPRMADDNNKEFSSQEPGPIWSGVFITEFILIFIINASTVTAFARNRHLRKCTTYLVINLTVADLLVGIVTGPLGIFKIKPGHGSSWREFCILTFIFLFPISSLANLSLISLERLHATLDPFRHCRIGKWVYFKVIICCWLLVLGLATLSAFLFLHEQVASMFLLASLAVLMLLMLTMSYIIIVVKVKSKPPPQQFHSVSVSNRKLSVTLSIVTVVSILTMLPWAISAVIPVTTWSQLSYEKTAKLLFYANSMVNPLIYAIRMQEFRKALKLKGLIIGKKTPGQRRAQPIELHAM